MLAARGKEAVECVHRENPDVILMDIRLDGDVDGIEAARQIMNFSLAKIIFVTGQTNPELKKQALALKPTAFLAKPVKIYDIQAVLQKLD